MRDEAIYMLLTISKAYSIEQRNVSPTAERDIIEATVTSLRILGVNSQELATATMSIMLDDSPIDRATKGMPKRPPQDMNSMMRDLMDLTFAMNDKNKDRN